MRFAWRISAMAAVAIAVSGAVVLGPAAAALAATDATLAPPVAHSLTPDFGGERGGTVVLIVGTDLVIGGTTVTFDGIPATQRAIGRTYLYVDSPPHAAGPVPVVVSTAAGASAPLTFRYLRDGSNARVTAIAPTSGTIIGGTTVRITGTELTGAYRVRFDDRQATAFQVNSTGTEITLRTPAHPAGPASMVLFFPGGSVALGTFTFVAPTVTSLSPTQGPASGGTQVTITGGDFSGAIGVEFDGTRGTSFAIDPAGTRITVTSPAHDPGAVGVALIFPEVATPAGTFTYVPSPVRLISPNQGPASGGTVVTITGTGLAGATGVTFGGQAGTSLAVNPAGTSLTVRTPRGPLGPVDVVVLLPGGATTTVREGYRYLPALPTIDLLFPDHGPARGGTTVTVTGIGFVPGGTSVTICGKTIPEREVTVVAGGRSLTFVTPPCGTGSTPIVTVTALGVSDGVTFRYDG
jgi:hypothetical protein